MKPSFNLNTCNKEKLKQCGEERAEHYFLWTLSFYAVKKNHGPLGFYSGQKQQVCRKESKHAQKGFCSLLLPSKTFQDEATTWVKDCFDCFKGRVACLMCSSMFRYETCVFLLWSTLFMNEKEVYSTNYGLYSRKQKVCFMLVSLIYTADGCPTGSGSQCGIPMWHGRVFCL